MNVALRGISKRFGDVQAVEAVDLEIRAGEVLALLGENGAGKSTLMKILYGVVPPDAGTIAVDGRPLTLDSPAAARAAGIGMVFQQWSLIPALTVAENLMLAWPKAPRWLAPRAPAWREVVRRLHALAPEVDPHARAGDLPVGAKQLVELAKVLNLGARVVILDEPTSVLARPEAERLWAEIRALAHAGSAVVLITHKLDDVAACADRVAVMRAGRLGCVSEEVKNAATLLTAMMGEQAARAAPRPRSPSARPRLVVDGVRALAGTQALAIDRLEVAGGEILGIAGVTGNGQELLGRVLAGVAPVRQGSVLLDGRSLAPARAHARPAVAYIPEQPSVNGCAPALSLVANLNLLAARTLRFVPRWKEARAQAAHALARFDVRPPNLDLPAGALSGGNLQKLVAARELSQGAPLLVAVYPTMGLDVGAARDVIDHVVAAAAGGAAVVWISEDLEALLDRADRVAVLHRGRLHGPIATTAATRQGLGAWMSGAAA